MGMSEIAMISANACFPRMCIHSTNFNGARIAPPWRETVGKAASANAPFSRGQIHPKDFLTKVMIIY